MTKFVADYADMMMERLLANTQKGDWDGCTTAWLMRELRRNAVKLDVAIQVQTPNKYIEEKAANIGNYANMVRDNYRREHPDR